MNEKLNTRDDYLKDMLFPTKPYRVQKWMVDLYKNHPLLKDMIDNDKTQIEEDTGDGYITIHPIVGKSV